MTEIGYVTAPLAGWNTFIDEAEADPEFQWPKSVPLVDRMRRDDPQIASVLLAVTLPLLESDWQLDCTGVRPEVARHVSQDLGIEIKGTVWEAPLRTKGRFTWNEHLPLALLELAFGHSVFEQVYEPDAFGRAHLKKLAWRPPRTIASFDVARDGGLVAVRQFGIGLSSPDPRRASFTLTSSPDATIPVNRLVVYVHQREGANWAGVSMLRPAYKMWLLKDRALRVQALASDRNGLGLPIYTSAPPPDFEDDAKVKAWLDAEIERGIQIARGARAGDTSGASLPNGATLTFNGVKGNLPDLDKQIRYYDEQIGRAALTNFLNLGGENSTGSYALGDTFRDFFTKSLNALARHIATITQQYVIEDLVDKNWGPTEPAPRLVPPKIGKEHPATAEAVRALLDSGAIKWDPSLEAHLRAQYGMPVRENIDAPEPPAVVEDPPEDDTDPAEAEDDPSPTDRAFRTRREAREFAARRSAASAGAKTHTPIQEAS
ncbi:hypothetical protein QE430_002485 [Microbacterium testaceum]|uniref:phage portal protein family protein n=1 Tax=Microbacterium testaceum TaxID=2033 RepID=UPI002786BDCD|nr:hypothetical protein [Microbacterium testaceum]MDQ1174178.1 hypothetical protein [Microbacterium testaceum]